jgi:hypothetical protein
MKKKKKMIFLCLLLVFIALFYIGCKNYGETEIKNTEIQHKIGVVVFDQDNPELRMFMNYYRDYIEGGFPVQFYFSDAVSSGEDEIAFIKKMKEQGVEGIISFYGLDLANTVKACEEEEMYYVLGSGTISEEEFNAVKSNTYFLGTIGPESSEETKAGEDMAADLADQGAKSYLILSGGSNASNYMHFERTIGMLNTLAEKWNLSYGESTEDLAVSETITKVETGNEEISITICPGYVTREEGKENLTQALKEGTYDAVLSAVGVNDVLDQLLSAEKEAGQDMLIGTVDCFSQENYDAILADDAYGNAEINYVKGKYASMVGPAFAALYNAMEGDLDVVKPDGEAFRLYQGFWSASGRDQYREMYGYTQDVYENAYSCADLMKVIKAFDEDADFDQLKALTEAYDLDSVKERILNADK